MPVKRAFSGLRAKFLNNLPGFCCTRCRSRFRAEKQKHGRQALSWPVLRCLSETRCIGEVACVLLWVAAFCLADQSKRQALACDCSDAFSSGVVLVIWSHVAFAFLVRKSMGLNVDFILVNGVPPPLNCFIICSTCSGTCV